MPDAPGPVLCGGSGGARVLAPLLAARPVPVCPPLTRLLFPQCRSRRRPWAPWRSRPARPSCAPPAGTCAGARCCGCRASTSTSSASSAKVSVWSAQRQRLQTGCQLPSAHRRLRAAGRPGAWKAGSRAFLRQCHLISVACATHGVTGVPGVSSRSCTPSRTQVRGPSSGHGGPGWVLVPAGRQRCGGAGPTPGHTRPAWRRKRASPFVPSEMAFVVSDGKERA